MFDMIPFSRKCKLILAPTTEDLQNISLFAIAISAAISCLYTWYGKNDGRDITRPFDAILPFVGLHAFVDFFITKQWDVKLHHLCIWGVISYNIYYDVSKEHRFLLLYPLVKTEISSIFYVLKYWLPKTSVMYHLNTAIFYLSFFKFRIYDVYNELLYKHIPFNVLIQNYSHSNDYLSSVSIVSCYGLYLLNLYWFVIMNKILYKTVAKIYNKIDTDQMCHLLCSYIPWINIPLSIYLYSHKPHEKYIFDIIGTVLLTASSYKYHTHIYQRLRDKEIIEYSVPDNESVVLFVKDSVSIHVRSFLTIATNYYSSRHLPFILLFSGISHAVSVFHGFLIILDLFIDRDTMKSVFVDCHNMILAIPIVFDVSMLFMNSSIEISLPFMLVNIIIGLLFAIQPFYKTTHVAFHLFLVAQNYYMCLSNTQ